MFSTRSLSHVVMYSFPSHLSCLTVLSLVLFSFGLFLSFLCFLEFHSELYLLFFFSTMIPSVLLLLQVLYLILPLLSSLSHRRCFGGFVLFDLYYLFGEYIFAAVYDIVIQYQRCSISIFDNFFQAFNPYRRADIKHVSSSINFTLTPLFVTCVFAPIVLIFLLIMLHLVFSSLMCSVVCQSVNIVIPRYLHLSVLCILPANVLNCGCFCTIYYCIFYVFPSGVLIIISVSLFISYEFASVLGSEPKLYISSRQSFNHSLSKHLTASAKDLYVFCFCAL